MVAPSASVITGLTPAVGSSSRMIFGSSISAREISSSFFCPPERFRAGSLASRQRSTCSSSGRARATAAACSARTRPGEPKQRHADSPLWCGLASSMFSSTVRLAELAGDLERAHQPGARALVGPQAEDAGALEPHVAGVGRDRRRRAR